MVTPMYTVGHKTNWRDVNLRTIFKEEAGEDIDERVWERLGEVKVVVVLTYIFKFAKE